MGSAVVGVLVGGGAVYGGLLARGGPPTPSPAVAPASPAEVTTVPIPVPVPMGTRIADAASLVRETVVSLEVGDEVGTGVVVDPSGVVLTNAWVVARALGSAPLPIRARMADERRFDANLLVADVGEDLAVVRLVTGDETLRFPAARFGASSDLVLGEELFAFSNPTGLPHSLMRALVAARERTGVFERVRAPVLQLDTSSSLGGYGGPLFDLRGTLVGLVTVDRVHAQGIAFALPSDHVQGFLRGVVDPALARSGTLGLSIAGEAAIPPQVAALGYRAGLVIEAVHPGGPAEAAGLRPGDVIVELRDRRLDVVPGSSPAAWAETLQTTVRAMYAGEILRVAIVRDAAVITVDVRVAAASETDQIFIDAQELLGLRLEPGAAVPTLAGVVAGSSVQAYGRALRGARIVRWMETPVVSLEEFGKHLATLRRFRTVRGPGSTVVLGVEDAGGRTLELPLQVR